MLFFKGKKTTLLLDDYSVKEALSVSEKYYFVLFLIVFGLGIKNVAEMSFPQKQIFSYSKVTHIYFIFKKMNE